MSDGSQPTVHPLRQRWADEHFPPNRQYGEGDESHTSQMRFNTYELVTNPGAWSSTLEDQDHGQSTRDHQQHVQRTSSGLNTYGMVTHPGARPSRIEDQVHGQSQKDHREHGQDPRDHQGHVQRTPAGLSAYGTVTDPSAWSPTVEDQSHGQSPREHQGHSQDLRDRQEHVQRTSLVIKSYASSHSQSERGVTELDAPSPVKGERKCGYLDDQQSSLRKSSSHRSSHHGRRQDLSEMAAPPPIEENKPPSDEETATGSQEDLEARRESEKAEVQPEHSAFLTELYTVSWLIFFSFWGTLARLGVEAITLYPNTPFPSRVLWANLGGSFVMGFLVEDRRLFSQEWGNGDPNSPSATHQKVKKTLPLFVGLSTGFCGCFTSFSSWMRDAFLALTNDLGAPSPIKPYQPDHQVLHSRNAGFSFLALLAILTVHSAVSLGALKAGANFALLTQPVTPILPFRFCRRVVDPLAVVLAFGCWLGSIFLSIWPPGKHIHWRFRTTFPLVFSPLGCLLRFYASRYLNARLPSFPLGTFAVNMFGTAVLGMAWDLQHAHGIGHGTGVQNVCSLLQGVMEGFCGCLTTVSTWVLELDGLRRRHAWIYGLTSVSVGLGIMVIIMGSIGWTIGFAPPSCG